MKEVFLFVVAVLLACSCQKELPIPSVSITSPIYRRVRGDTLFIRAFYGHQGLIPPNVGTVVFPQPAYEVSPQNKLAFMSAYTGLNGYGDSAGTIRKNALNDYNGELYNIDINALPNTRITITPVNNPKAESNSISADSTFAYTRFFQTPRQIAISISLINGMWEYKDTSASGRITIYQMNPLLLVASESVETGLATRNGAQKLVNGQSESYMAFVNQKGYIIQPPKRAGEKLVVWHPRLHGK